MSQLANFGKVFPSANDANKILKKIQNVRDLKY